MAAKVETSSGDAHVPGPVAPGAVWSAITSEPNTGVTVISMEGSIRWANDQAAKIFFGPDAKGGPYVGKAMSDLFPEAWVEERRVLLHKILETRRPTLIRVIWRGFQHLSWITHIEKDGADTEPDEYSRPEEEQFLCITRRVGGDEDAEDLAAGKYDVVESEFVDLGPLEVLSARELEVLALIGQGLRAEEIARVLSRSVKTIGNHRDSIAKKLDAHDRVHLAEIARRAGLTLGDAERSRV